MGGGKLTRTGIDRPQASEAFAQTEFYLLLQRALDKTPRLTLPGCWAEFRPTPERKLYAEDMAECCSFTGVQRPGLVQVFAPSVFSVAYGTLYADARGCPAALLLTREVDRTTLAVQILPPVLCEAPPPMPDSTSALSLQLTFEDLDRADADPDALARDLRDRTAGKTWLCHPQIDSWTAKALAAAQRDYNRRHAEAARPRAPWEK